MTKPLVAILMGSDSDLPTMRGACTVLDDYDVAHEIHVMSAHRSPERLVAFLHDAPARGVRVFIAGAGMAAHLAGVVAAHTSLPVIGVPLASSAGLGGADALYATVQMPPGIPVATVAINGAKNAAHLAVRMLALADDSLEAKVAAFRAQMDVDATAKDDSLQELGAAGYLKAKGG